MQKNSIKKVVRFLRLFIVSLGGVGFIMPASATWGSLWAGIILYFTFPDLLYWQKEIIIVATFIIGTILSDQVEKTHKTHDPYYVVIDEAVGMMIVTSFLQQVWWHFALAFVLFRIFDIAKLWPASVFDKKEGGFALMVDDVIMAIPAAGILFLLLMVY